MNAVFVTGGTGEIGSAIVRYFADREYRVHFQYVSSDESAEKLASDTGATPVKLDFSSQYDLPDLEFDVVVNNAGINISGTPSLKTPIAQIEETLRVNLFTNIDICQKYAPIMVEKKFGRIININSLYGLRAAPNRLSYAMSKHALRCFTLTMALELAETGVTVNEICPGPVSSNMLTQMGEMAIKQGRAANLDDYHQIVAQGVPIRRLIEPTEIAEAACFLASNKSASITGLSLSVDGGMLIS